MATPSEVQLQDKTVTGYPAQPSQVAAGYPAVHAYPPPPPPPSAHFYDHRPTVPIHNHYQYNNGAPVPPNHPNLRRRLIIAAVAIFSIIAVVYFISWLILKPHVPEFRVDSANVSQFNTTRSELNATWVFTLLVRNTNHRLSISYDSLEAYVFYGGENLLGKVDLPDFFQAKRNETRLVFGIVAVGKYVGEETVEGILKEMDGGSVRFEVGVEGWIRFSTGMWGTREQLIKVYCDSLQFGFDPNRSTGNLMGQSGVCDVDL